MPFEFVHGNKGIAEVAGAVASGVLEGRQLKQERQIQEEHNRFQILRNDALQAQNDAEAAEFERVQNYIAQVGGELDGFNVGLATPTKIEGLTDFGEGGVGLQMTPIDRARYTAARSNKERQDILLDAKLDAIERRTAAEVDFMSKELATLTERGLLDPNEAKAILDDLGNSHNNPSAAVIAHAKVRAAQAEAAQKIEDEATYQRQLASAHQAHQLIASQSAEKGALADKLVGELTAETDPVKRQRKLDQLQVMANNLEAYVAQQVEEQVEARMAEMDEQALAAQAAPEGEDQVARRMAVSDHFQGIAKEGKGIKPQDLGKNQQAKLMETVREFVDTLPDDATDEDQQKAVRKFLMSKGIKYDRKYILENWHLESGRKGEDGLPFDKFQNQGAEFFGPAN